MRQSVGDIVIDETKPYKTPADLTHSLSLAAIIESTDTFTVST